MPFFGYPLEKLKGPFVCVSIKRNRSFRKLGLDRENIKYVTLYSRSKVDSRRYLRLQDFTDRSLPFYNGYLVRDFTHAASPRVPRTLARVISIGREMDELRARLAQVELERDQAVADFNRRNAQLAQMEETQRTLHEHLYILKTKYETAKVRTPPRPVTSAWALS